MTYETKWNMYWKIPTFWVIFKHADFVCQNKLHQNSFEIHDLSPLEVHMYKIGGKHDFTDLDISRSITWDLRTF